MGLFSSEAKHDDQKTDEKLVELYLSTKNHSYFNQIYRRTSKDVYRFIFVRVGNKESAEEIASETYITLLSIIDRFNSKSKFKTFLFGIALNKIKQFFDTNKTHSSLDEVDEFIATNDYDSVDEEIENNQEELRPVLKKLLDELKPPQGSVLYERFINNCSIKETAEKLNLTEANVRVIQHRALKNAYSKLKSEFK